MLGTRSNHSERKLRLWLNMIVERSNKMFLSYSDYIIEAYGFHSQKKVSNIISAHLKMFEKYYLKH